MRNYITGIVALAVVSCAAPENKGTTEVTLTNDADSASYAIGMDIASNLKRGEMGDLSASIIAAGLEAGMGADSTLLDEPTAQMAIRNFMMAKQAKAQAEAPPVNQAGLAEGQAFLAQNGQREGVVTTASGLQYEILKEGTGAKPTLSDKVNTHYHGTLLDGTVFDSSVDRGQPISFGVGQVIRGWTEALQLMSVGSKWKLFIPSNLAYGPRDTGKIPANSTLIFEVELLGIE